MTFSIYSVPIESLPEAPPVAPTSLLEKDGAELVLRRARHLGALTAQGGLDAGELALAALAVGVDGERAGLRPSEVEAAWRVGFKEPAGTLEADLRTRIARIARAHGVSVESVTATFDVFESGEAPGPLWTFGIRAPRGRGFATLGSGSTLDEAEAAILRRV